MRYLVNVCNNHKALSRKIYLQFELFYVLVTLKLGQGHQSEHYHHATFERSRQDSRRKRANVHVFAADCRAHANSYRWTVTITHSLFHASQQKAGSSKHTVLLYIQKAMNGSYNDHHYLNYFPGRIWTKVCSQHSRRTFWRQNEQGLMYRSCSQKHTRAENVHVVWYCPIEKAFVQPSFLVKNTEYCVWSEWVPIEKSGKVWSFSSSDPNELQHF